MLVTKKTLMATENQLQSCRLLLSDSHDQLQAIRGAVDVGGGIYKRILECREMADNVRRLGGAVACHESMMLLDHLAFFDGWLLHLANHMTRTPVYQKHLERAVRVGDVSVIYQGSR
ncbi:hypothetical protein [Serratia ficaria]|uniref:hypothetical protein n=1 Tax=Serratia ficaria TaxID=61651 RepID=UPI0021C6D4F5|nr:hypothetical protein [Serratia ficaria]